MRPPRAACAPRASSASLRQGRRTARRARARSRTPERAAETRQYGTRVAILARWRYCPRCAAELTHLGAKVECGACGFVRYANPLPAVAVLVVDGENRL